MHRIQQREIREKMGQPQSLMEEISKSNVINTKPKIEVLATVNNNVETPQYRMYKKKDGTHVYVEVLLKNVVSFVSSHIWCPLAFLTSLPNFSLCALWYLLNGNESNGVFSGNLQIHIISISFSNMLKYCDD